MNSYIKHDEWNIIEEGFHPEYNKVSESVFSIGNGLMGQRANFEEQYSGDSLQGSYIAGIYYPDKTRVGWWKNGYPESFAKVLNSANWIGINIVVDGEFLDLHTAEIKEFRRVLNMRQGYLERSFVARLENGKELKVVSTRFCSMVNNEAAALRYSVTPINFDGRLHIQPYIDFDVKNQDANYGDVFWEEVSKDVISRKAYVTAKTKKTDFHVCAGMKFSIMQNGTKAYFEAHPVEKENYVANSVSVLATKGKEVIIYKYVGIVSSFYHAKNELVDICKEIVESSSKKGFELMLEEHAAAWEQKWEECDIVIEGDIAAQQGIRFNIFQLNQTYTGKDERLNIGPKGFTGEKYGGSTYWDTEAYCLPFFMSTADQKVAKQLLVYRYKHLSKAIENAAKLGFKNGAALYPMVTMNGEECHNEWEITFEEIHRNGAIAYAIYDYIRYTGDENYLCECGAEVLLGIARFWAQRVNYSQAKKKYVILGVTGPNEYENNVNNNWYTNYIAAWCLEYAKYALEYVKKKQDWHYMQIVDETGFDESEFAKWADIIENMYYPDDKKKGVFLQQDGFLDKDLMTTDQLQPEDRPINRHWSWDRILRSCFVKHADVLQGMYFFEDKFDTDTIRRNFDFYEPMTVHESSLSPCVHVILASKLGYNDRAYELYLRTSRLDLDNYNSDTHDGCHITSMAGTWMSIVKGFGGMRVWDGSLHFNPIIPPQWKSYSFKVHWRNYSIKVNVSEESIDLENQTDKSIELFVHGTKYTMGKLDVLCVKR